MIILALHRFLCGAFLWEFLGRDEKIIKPSFIVIAF